jgi:ABC-type dipeptide/oligopeptide/nickel transport system permease subunit
MLLNRVIYGGQISLTVGDSGVLIGALVGITTGVLACYRSGTFEQVAWNRTHQRGAVCSPRPEAT